jgi:hypothetical protein
MTTHDISIDTLQAFVFGLGFIGLMDIIISLPYLIILHGEYSQLAFITEKTK